MNSLRNKKICLKEFIPEKVMNKHDNGKSYDINIIEDECYLTLSYEVDAHNQHGKIGQRCFTLLLPKYIRRNKETFEVLGLLQAEMGKQLDGKIAFCNHEFQLINKIFKWFDKEFDLAKDKWNWYIKLNINEPSDTTYKREVEDKVINYWMQKSGLSIEQSYNKKVSYIKHTPNKQLGFYDYGTLIIEYANNLFSQVIKQLVKKIFYDISNFENAEISGFMKGIIAGESNIDLDQSAGHYRIYISAKELQERKSYQTCLKKLGIESTVYSNFHGLVISKKENNLELLKQKLTTLSPEKYNKFLRMVKLYENFDGLDDWKKNVQKPWNKIPQEKIDKIIVLDKQHPDWPAWKIAEQVGVSDIKVQRVRKQIKKTGWKLYSNNSRKPF
jgi:predicted CopG family antitoxin